MNNFWLNRAEERAMTMEQKIEKMLAPHHVIWLGDDTVGRDAKPVPTNSNAPIPSETKVDWGTIPSQITINCPVQMAEWDSLTVSVSGPCVRTDTAGVVAMMPANAHFDINSTYFDINTCSPNLEASIKECMEDNDFAISVESEGWNLDL